MQHYQPATVASHRKHAIFGVAEQTRPV